MLRARCLHDKLTENLENTFMTTSNDTFGDRLTLTILDRMTKKSAVAAYCGITRANITKYCKNMHTPQRLILEKLCICLDCSPNWLLKGEGSIKDKYDYSQFNDALKIEEKVKMERKGKDFRLTIDLSEKEVMGMWRSCFL